MLVDGRCTNPVQVICVNIERGVAIDVPVRMLGEAEMNHHHAVHRDFRRWFSGLV